MTPHPSLNTIQSMQLTGIQLTVMQLKELLDLENPPLLLDVREDEEIKICALPNFVHLPLGQLAMKWDQLPKDRLIVAYCHHGYRSLQAIQFLRSHGYEQVLNLEGGIQAWATQVDTTMERY
jgi:rhodanese-related sulfurtransferase